MSWGVGSSPALSARVELPQVRLNGETRRRMTLAPFEYGNGAIHRGVVQLVECRSPKPEVVGSSPAAPANIWVCKLVTVAGPPWKGGSSFED